MEYSVYIGGRTYQVRMEEGAVTVVAETGQHTLEVDLSPAAGPVRSVRVGGRSRRVIPLRNGRGAWSLVVDGCGYRAEVLDPAEAAARKAVRKSQALSGPAPLKAPMPGLIIRVEVEVGDEVGQGDGLVVVEAMKMENELRAVAAGRVTRVHAREGETVEKGQVLVEFDPVEEAS